MRSQQIERNEICGGKKKNLQTNLNEETTNEDKQPINKEQF